MDDFRSYSPEAVIASNLAETSQRLDQMIEQEHAHIAELAAEILTDAQQPSDFLVSLPDRRPPPIASSSTTLSQNQPLVDQIHASHAVWRSVLLCSLLRKGLNLGKHDLPDDFFPEVEELSDFAKNRVIFQRTNYADLAYRAFAKRLSSPHALYTHNFTLACEEVERGNCEYCILPLENSSEGALHSFSRLIDRFALKIVASCDVPTEDGTRITRFALLRRNLSPLFEPICPETVFECVIPNENSPSVASLLLAAQWCGLKLSHVDSRLHTLDETAVSKTHFLFTVGNGDLCAFLLYLAMEAPDYEVPGIYKHPSP